MLWLHLSLSLPSSYSLYFRGQHSRTGGMRVTLHQQRDGVGVGLGDLRGTGTVT